MQTINYQVKNKIAVITFKRPDVFNAMNVQMKMDIISAIKNANKDPLVGAIVITAEGKAFTAGQDLNDRTVQNEGNKRPDLGHTLKTEWNPLIESIRNSPKVVIAAINGVCAGAGISVALSCDLKVAKPKTKFVSGFAAIALTLDAGSGHTLSRHLGYSKALEFALLGTPLFAEDLLAAGLINTVAENELETAMKMAEIISELAPQTVELTKQNLQFALDNPFKNVIERETFSQRFLGSCDDYAEGVKAFLEKRKPSFKGV